MPDSKEEFTSSKGSHSIGHQHEGYFEISKVERQTLLRSLWQYERTTIATTNVNMAKE